MRRPAAAPSARAEAARAIRSVGVVGAGTMGSAIAQKLALEGASVVVVDQSRELLDRALERVRAVFDEGVGRKALKRDRAEAALSRLRLSLELSELREADLVLEAIFEDEAAKAELFAKLDGLCSERTIFATNTSSLSVSALAARTRRPDRFLGLHFFYHPVKNRLVEVVPGEATSRATLDRTLAFAKSAGKTPIVCGDRPGFAVNRFFVPWLNEAARMLEEGQDAATIDEAARRSFGIGMGPFELMNATGVPIALHAAEGLSRALGSFYAPAAALKEAASSGRPWPLEGAADPAGLEGASERLWGVVFTVASALVEEGTASREDVDRGARIGLRWSKGPFERMNELGPRAAAGWAERACAGGGLAVPESLKERARSGRGWELRSVDLHKEGPLARVVLNRPEALNALDEELLTQLGRAVEEAGADPTVRAIVLEGAGKAFVAGADVRFFLRCLEKGDLDAIAAFTRLGQRVLRAIELSTKPVAARLEGAALGGGAELALACRYRLGTPKAVLRLPETGLGIYPGLGGTQRLPRLVGKELAKHFIFTGEPIPAALALELGILDVVGAPEDLDLAALELAGSGRLARRGGAPGPEAGKLRARAVTSLPEGGLPGKAPAALRLADRLIEEGSALELDAALELELGSLREIFSTGDAREGLSALLERRAPAFKGR